MTVRASHLHTVQDPEEELRERTNLPRLDLPEEPATQEKVVIGVAREEVTSILGAAAAGIAVGLLLCTALNIVNIVWMPVISYLWFIGTYATLVFLTQRGPAVKDRFWSVLLWSAAVVVVASLVLVIGVTTQLGWGAIWHLNFFTQDMSVTSALVGLDKGGVLHALVGTLEQIGIALLISVPFSITTAVFLSEIGGRFARLVRTVVEAMTALPSVVAGLFIYAAVIVGITRQFNGFAASLAISILMIPIMIRSADVVLRLVPGNLREAGLALGAGQWSVVRHVVLPTIRSGLVTSIILGTAHGIGETAPVLLTAGATNNMNFNPFDQPQVSLPLAALELVKTGLANFQVRGYATALFLLLVVLILFVLARVLGGQEAGQLTSGQQRRRASASRRLLQRLESNPYQASSSPDALNSQETHS